jgi:hypothetical protein
VASRGTGCSRDPCLASGERGASCISPPWALQPVASPPRQEVSESIGLGQSSRSRAIASRGAEARAHKPTSRPLAREPSAGRASMHGHSHSASSPVSGLQGPWANAKNSCHRGRPHWWCARSGRSSGRDRGSYSVAEVVRRRAAIGTPRVKSSGGVLSSSPSKRERGGAKERRKPFRRWQNRETVAGSLHNGTGERRSSGAPVDGRRFGPWIPTSLTRGRRKRSYQRERAGPHGGLRLSLRRETPDTGRQFRARPTTPRRRGLLTRETLPSASRRVDDTGKLGLTPSSVLHPGSGHTAAHENARRRPDATVTPGLGPPVTVGRRAATPTRPGSRTTHGCSCQRSVAEVDEEHLPRPARGEPRGEPKPRRGRVAIGARFQTKRTSG